MNFLFYFLLGFSGGMFAVFFIFIVVSIYYKNKKRKDQ